MNGSDFFAREVMLLLYSQIFFIEKENLLRDFKNPCHMSREKFRS